MKRLQSLRSLFLVVVVLLCVQGYSQEPCGSPMYIDYLDSLFPGAKQAVDKTYMDAVREGQAKSKFEIDTVYKIRVVFHVVYSSQEGNVPDEYIYSQLKVLNDCYRRTNADTTDTREIFKDVAGDAHIEFELAQVDPDGNYTNGILRKQTLVPTFGTGDYDYRDRVKSQPYGSVPWDTEKYLNIWVCNLAVGGVDRLLGYAYPPIDAAFWGNANFTTSKEKQGVVLHYKVLGELTGGLPYSNEGKALVHEVGHYLGLRHIWGDGGCSMDDFLDDTPTASRPHSGCVLGVNTCGFGIEGDLPDMIENYMDYSSDACLNMFSEQQVAHMRHNLRELRSGIFSEEIIWPEKPAFVEGSIGVYPNPAMDVLNVYMENSSSDKTYRIQFYNILGQSELQVYLSAHLFQTVRGLSGLKGPHFYRIFEDDFEVSKGEIIFSY